MGYSIGTVRRAFGIFFISIAIGVAAASSLTEITSLYHIAYYFYPIIWIGILAGTISAFVFRYPHMFKAMRGRFMQSVQWSLRMKIVAGACWVVPFVLIAVFPNYYLDLILLGIGLGNTSTYLVTRKVSGASFSEQLMVGAISLASLPVIFFLGSSHIFSDDMLQFLTRLFIASAYGAGGAYTFQLEL